MRDNIPSGIAIVGANGSGKTTLGAQLSKALGYQHMDVEDYYFRESSVPYANPRTREEVQGLLLADIKKHGRFILSSVNCDFGDTINALFDCIVYITAPLDVRMERVKNRAYEKFGPRVLEGGDMYEQEQKFFDFVASRTMDKTDAWIQSMPCPVIYVDGTKPVSSNVEFIKEYVAPTPQGFRV